MKMKRVLIGFCAALFAWSVTPSFAATAPVYDADAMVPYGSPAEGAEAVPEPPADVPVSVNAGSTPPQTAQPVDEVVAGAAPSLPVVNVSGEVAAASVPTSSMSTAQRLKRIELQLQGLDQANASSRVESLQNQVQVLRNQVEQLTHELEQMKSQQKVLYSDLDQRLSQSESAIKTKKITPEDGGSTQADSKRAVSQPNSKVVTTKKSEAEQPDTAEEQRIYQEAYNLIKAKKYADAVTSLKGMLTKYPSGQFASNAHYWLGELYGLLGNHRQSLTEFDMVINNFPDSSRVSDAQLKIGLIHAAQSDWEKAKLVFNLVNKKYPGTASARLAKEQLKQLKQAGH